MFKSVTKKEIKSFAYKVDKISYILRERRKQERLIDTSNNTNLTALQS